jgi:hypothetical protein
MICNVLWFVSMDFPLSTLFYWILLSENTPLICADGLDVFMTIFSRVIQCREGSCYCFRCQAGPHVRRFIAWSCVREYVQLAPSVLHGEVAVSMLVLYISISLAIAVLLICCVLCVLCQDVLPAPDTQDSPVLPSTANSVDKASTKWVFRS